MINRLYQEIRSRPGVGWLSVGLLLKILLGTMLASHFMTQYFAPFVNYFYTSGFANPYDYFVGNNTVDAFPYPALMLYILTLPKLLLGWLYPHEGIHSFDLFLYRLPLLLADIVIFLVLYSWLKDKFSKLIWFYWLSPVLIYISYIHGQLDIIPISLLFVSLFYLFKSRLLLAALFLGLALASKTHIILTLPFFLFYLTSQHLKVKEHLTFFGIITAVFLIINLPYLSDPSFLTMIFFNSQQGKIFDFSFNLNQNAIFYIIPACYLLLFLKAALLKSYNRNIFLMFLGFSFGIILLFIPPMQGWYCWLIPFFAYFYIKEKGRSPLLFFALQAFYILYFLVTKNSDYIEALQHTWPALDHVDNLYAYLSSNGINPDVLVYLSLTLLQTTLFINCIWIYQRGLESYSKHKITSQPYLVGIGGDSGVGKTTLSQALVNIFGINNTTVLKGDDMHKWERGDDNWQHLTHLNPKANHLHQEIHYLAQLRKGNAISRRYYDHDRGQFTEEQRILSNKLVILEGLHPFYLESQRELYDVKIFIRPEEQLAHHWKIVRDMYARGHSKETILKQIKTREKDSKTHIHTQSNHADVLIEILSREQINDIGNPKEDIHIYFRLHLPNSIYLDPLLNILSEVSTLDIKHDYDEQHRQVIDIDGTIPGSELSQIGQLYIPGLQDIGINTPAWPDNHFGVLVLLLCYYIFEDADHES